MWEEPIDGKPSFKESYVSAIKHLRDVSDVSAIVTGDMDLVGTMKRNWIEECCEQAEIKCHLPLWKADRATCLDQLLVEGITAVFTCVKPPWFDASWIGR